MAARVGIDLVSVEAVRQSLSEHGEHYLRRVYSEREVRDCTTPSGADPERLAARFAAKEATLKVLRPADVGIPWFTIEVVRRPEGWVALELAGAAAELASQAGITELALSISHEGGFATAVVVATCASETRDQGR
ncbi:MAG TPA: 4'-phosphopantetheinyl transferase superfamily protein [Solirubrobacteraceae bacterium]|jgi:holo-[acyl-carrier protein] synthase|nr:4'-phosphopantetheinyl transferase superfamily protein [Solirubrobacteraceae bacterium]